MSKNFKKNITSVGYVEAIPRPSQEELDIFYRDTYYSDGITATYSTSYSDDEIKQKRLRADCIVQLIAQNCSLEDTVNFLELGCGEGFLLSSAVAKGWAVTGVDYQSMPVQKFNPQVISSVIAAPPNEYLNTLIERGLKTDILVLQNVLEHVLNPEELLCKLQKLLSDEGCLLIQVPNDFSDFQALAHQYERIDRDYWFLPPQHLNYFNENTLSALASKCGFNIADGITDFPIEMYLWGNAENYVTHKSNGKFAHQARVALDLFFARCGLDKYLQFYRAAFQIGVGRNLCVVLKKSAIL